MISFGKIKPLIVKAGMGVAVGLGVAAVSSKLPVIGGWAQWVGMAGSYFAGGLPGIAAYALSSGALGQITGGSTTTAWYG